MSQVHNVTHAPLHSEALPDRAPYSRCNVPRHRRQIAVKVAAESLSRSFGSGETIAILPRRNSPVAMVYRIMPLERMLRLLSRSRQRCRTAAMLSLVCLRLPKMMGLVA